MVLLHDFTAVEVGREHAAVNITLGCGLIQVLFVIIFKVDGVDLR